jgi:hypothetical protein
MYSTALSDAYAGYRLPITQLAVCERIGFVADVSSSVAWRGERANGWARKGV